MKVKIIEDFKKAGAGASFYKGEVLEARTSEKLPGWLTVKRLGDEATLFPEDVKKYTQSVPDETPLNVIAQAGEKGILAHLPLILGTIGGIGGLYYAHTQKCGFWGYVGYMVAGNIAGGGVGTVVKVVATGKE